jgi:acyl phosphate:glycerol-3-phosphate acyltransferase
MLGTMNRTAVVLAGFGAGSIPFSNVASRRTRGVDLRDVGSGTVSGTALYRVAGFTPLAVAGVLDVGKGALGPLLAGRGRPLLAAVAGGAAVVGHNWSPWLGGAGGRGIAPALGSLLATAPPGVPVLAAGLIAGRLLRQTGLGSFVALAALVPVLTRTSGRRGAVAGACIAVPMAAKRLAGNRRLAGPARPRAYLRRLLFDNDGEAV